MDEVGRKPALYQIRVRGKLGSHWSDWCGGLDFASEEAVDGSLDTTLTGIVADQAALRGILTKLWDLGLTLLSVSRIEPESSRQGEESEDEQLHTTSG
jgi:hypothetical protein